MMDTKREYIANQMYQYEVVVTKYEPDLEDGTCSSNSQDGQQEPRFSETTMLKQEPSSDNIPIVFLDPKEEIQTNDYSIEKEFESMEILKVFEENKPEKSLKRKVDYVSIKDEINEEIDFDVDSNGSHINNNFESKDMYTNILESQKNKTDALSKCVSNFEGTITNNIDNNNIHKNSRPYRCEICGKEFLKIFSFKTHMVTHKDPAFTCEICNRNYSSAGNLKVHMVTHTGEKPYKCSICKLKFNHLSNYKRHFKKHTQDTNKKLYKCEYCDKGFTTSYNLQLHIRIHTGDKPYKCDICGKASARLDDIKKHIQTIHDSFRPFKCDICQKTFKESSHLNRHMKIHTDSRPYKCDKCERAFKDRSDMNKHKRKCKYNV